MSKDGIWGTQVAYNTTRAATFQHVFAVCLATCDTQTTTSFLFNSSNATPKCTSSTVF